MNVDTDSGKMSLQEQLVSEGYWVACAAKSLDEGKFSVAVRLCKEHLPGQSDLISGHLVYGRALFQSGQAESAADQFHRVLALDPENLVALKYLGDVKYASGDELAAMANYRRILEIDPLCCGLKSSVRKPSSEKTRTITLNRPARSESKGRSSREIPFFTETMGDLYLSQGYNRLASRVFNHLMEQNENPRLAEKLARAQGKIKDKES